MKHKKQGFTLIELLIVVVVVGILAGMFMLAGGEAQSMAKATKIVNGLTDVKMAVLTWYRENTDKIDKDGKINTQDPNAYFTADKISKYLSDGKSFAIGTSDGNYQIVFGMNNKGKPTWYVCYQLESQNDKNDVIDKLKDKAEAHGYLLHGVPIGSGKGNWEKYSKANSDAEKIYMEILTFDF